MFVVHSSEVRVEILEGKFLLAELGPVVVLGSDGGDDDGVEDGGAGRCDSTVDTWENLTGGGYGDRAREVVCCAQPDGDTGGEAHDGSEDGGWFALAAPEDGECHWEDAGAGYNA